MRNHEWLREACLVGPGKHVEYIADEIEGKLPTKPARPLLDQTLSTFECPSCRRTLPARQGQHVRDAIGRAIKVCYACYRLGPAQVYANIAFRSLA